MLEVREREGSVVLGAREDCGKWQRSIEAISRSRKTTRERQGGLTE